MSLIWFLLMKKQMRKSKSILKTSVWTFNSSFLSSHSKADEKVFQILAEQCESSNEAVFSLIDDFDHFVEDAIMSDGRGHFLNHYDGAEEGVFKLLYLQMLRTINAVEFYLDYFNNYLTVQATADAYGINKETANRLINLGRIYNNN